MVGTTILNRITMMLVRITVAITMEVVVTNELVNVITIDIAFSANEYCLP